MKIKLVSSGAPQYLNFLKYGDKIEIKMFISCDINVKVLL